MTIKANLLNSSHMSPIERQMGRFMRGPDSHEISADDFRIDGEEETEEKDEKTVDKPEEGRLNDEQSAAEEDDDADDKDEDEPEGEPKAKDVQDKPEGDGGQRLPKRAQRRIDRLTRELNETREALAKAKGEGERGKADKPSDTPNSDATPPKPVVTDFDTYEDFTEALAEWKADRRFETLMAERQAKETAKQAEQTFAAKFKEGRSEFKDWDEVVTDDTEVTGHMLEAIKEAEFPARIVYYLGQNPEEADRIANLSPTKQIVEIGKIEAKLSSKDEKPPVKQSGKKVSGAPAPAEPVKQETGKITKSIDDMSPDEFIRYMNKKEGIERVY